jgi:dethiobiotin synthetase
MVAGIGTDVGKTLVSAILTTQLQADYWKPIQSGDEECLDTTLMRRWLDPSKHKVHQPAYSFKAPLSPHHASRLEGVSIDAHKMIVPDTSKTLIIEGVGGVFVPLSIDLLSIDVFQEWNCRWVIVSKHYLGSINHTLLTIEALKQRNIPILGIIFNGLKNDDSEAAIIQNSKVPFLARLLPEQNFNQQTIQRYALQWRSIMQNLLY